ncbi:MAG TPA: hypothetical protein VMV35_04700 [Halothiobacillus sp.]|nr:hypothetical protein [Halothiobacillus sp.]
MHEQAALMPDGFVIPAFNTARPFASFLPGIGGDYGKPLWVFYTNRGQCVSSFGVRDRNGAMLEFHPADQAYALTSLYGFRTFFKIPARGGTLCHEPFQNSTVAGVTQKLTIRPEEIEIEETHADFGLRIRIVYFTLPNETLPVLVRRVTVENISSVGLHAEVLDGLPRIVPFGLDEHSLKQMSRTMQAFAEIRHVDDNLPFYKLKVVPSDKPEMERIDAGFFAFTLQHGQPVGMVADPEQVFGPDTSLRQPLAFLNSDGIDPLAGRRETLTGCAFARLTLSLEAGAATGWDSFFGQASGWEAARDFREHAAAEGNYAGHKRAENSALIIHISGQFDIVAAPPQLAPYTRQGFLDNTLRGGQPVVIDGPRGLRVFHTFTRKHGDMERDYNFFNVSPTFLSQGNGNYRDVNQNRRSENYVFPGIDSANIETFFNLIQIDGNNPLVVQAEKFSLPQDQINKLQASWMPAKTREWQTLLERPFSPGQLLEKLLDTGESIDAAQDIFKIIVGLADPVQDATHGEGYWVDHWIYNLDLLDSYAGLYPDRLRSLLVERRDFCYFDNDHVVQPRAKKYTLRKDGTVRQLHAVIVDAGKAKLIARRSEARNWMRTGHGTGPVYRTTLLAKLVNLIAIKTSLLDPFGVGLEMETDKPGWCDALNGLPGLFGSSTHEAYALRRCIAFARAAITQHLAQAGSLSMPVEVAGFVRSLTPVLGSAKANDFFPTWRQLAKLREDFRDRVRMGISGEEADLSSDELLKFCDAADALLQRGLAKALGSDGVPVSYFIHQAESYEVLIDTAAPQSVEDQPTVVYVQVTRFSQMPVASFLEGAVHALRGTDDTSAAATIYHAVRQSMLYDRKLGMYRVNAPLDGESFEIGRGRIFTPGWLENESIFLHMHYKFLLETLRSGLAQEFFDDMRLGLVAFQRAEVYGRSPLENSSFIASSRFPDAKSHGVGFVARLSGATAEWISMVLHMGLGAAPFHMVEDALRFEPRPTLAEWLFTTEPNDDFGTDSFGLKLFGQTWVVYENPGRHATFGADAVAPVRFDLHYHDARRGCLTAAVGCPKGWPSTCANAGCPGW